MKRWAALVVLLYALILITLSLPLGYVAFFPTVSVRVPQNLMELVAAVSVWQYWVALGVLLVAQAVMLIVPVKISMSRPTAQRSVLWTILASGLMMGVLAAAAAVSLEEFWRKDKVSTGDAALPWIILLMIWVIWSLAFYRTSRGAAAMDVVAQQCRFLLKGSILELLVAVPTHIVARSRNYCCAGLYTFVGIAFGLAVMLFSYGPGVFFLFAARWKRLHPQRTGINSPQ